jgi:hypothetical protein
MEFDKHAHDNAVYFDYIKQLDGLYDNPLELIYQFPIYAGAVNIAKFLAHYEIYKQVIDKAGHIADVASHKGRSLLTFAKMVKLFEPHSFTEVHGFEWFKGMKPGKEDHASRKGKYVGEHGRLQKLIELQGFDQYTFIHNVDLTKDLPKFFKGRPDLRFKLVYIDCAVAKVMESSLTYFWPRLVHGGILIMDHYSHSISPQESTITDRFIGDRVVRQIPITRLPTAYVVK